MKVFTEQELLAIENQTEIQHLDIMRELHTQNKQLVSHIRHLQKRLEEIRLRAIEIDGNPDNMNAFLNRLCAELEEL